MLRSYVGIASRRGLVAFVPEHGPAVRRLLEKTYGAPSPIDAVCWWAFLDEDGAATVLQELEQGEHVRALVTLNQQAAQIGPILPGDVVSEPAANRFCAH